MVEYLTIPEAATRLHVTRQTVYRWIKEGRIDPVWTPGGSYRVPDDQLIQSAATPPSRTYNDRKIFPVTNISEFEPEIIEQLGTKFKFWYRTQVGKRVLFKEGRPGTGENWAEKAASELCGLLGLPHVPYELAVWKGKEGVVCDDFEPPGGRLVHGNELLALREDAYDRDKRYRQGQHTLRLVLDTIRDEVLEVPLDWNPFDIIESPIDVFVGYLMLDTWIANQDRHHQNWGLVLTKDQVTHLAPSFDHASSLGRNESDDVRKERLVTKDKARSIERYVEKARSAFYASPESARPMFTIEAFEMAAMQSRDAARSWLGRLEQVASADTMSVFERIPDTKITPAAVEFAQHMLELNRERLLGLRKGL